MQTVATHLEVQSCDKLLLIVFCLSPSPPPEGSEKFLNLKCELKCVFVCMFSFLFFASLCSACSWPFSEPHLVFFTLVFAWKEKKKKKETTTFLSKLQYILLISFKAQVVKRQTYISMYKYPLPLHELSTNLMLIKSLWFDNLW